MTYPNSQIVTTSSLRGARSVTKLSPTSDREAAYDNLQNVILKLAVKKDNVRSAPAARTEFTQLVEQALEAYRQYMRTIGSAQVLPPR